MSVVVLHGAEVAQDLYGRITSHGEILAIAGYATKGDIDTFEFWQYDANSSLSDTFTANPSTGDVIKPTLQTGNGRWIRLGKFQKQTDWDEDDDSKAGFLKNRPNISGRQETYSGTTDSDGLYTVTFGTSYSNVPNVHATIRNQSDHNQLLMVSNVTVNGFTVHALQRNVTTLLGVEVLLGTVVDLQGATIDVLVTAQ